MALSPSLSVASTHTALQTSAKHSTLIGAMISGKCASREMGAPLLEMSPEILRDCCCARYTAAAAVEKAVLNSRGASAPAGVLITRPLAPQPAGLGSGGEAVAAVSV